MEESFIESLLAALAVLSPLAIYPVMLLIERLLG